MKEKKKIKQNKFDMCNVNKSKVFNSIKVISVLNTYIIYTCVKVQTSPQAKDPLDYEAFIELMSHRTVELDPEDVLLEAWSKWDDYGTGKIEEKK